MPKLDYLWIKKLSQNAVNAFRAAVKIAVDQNSSSVNIEHLFLGILSNKNNLASQALESIGIDVERTRMRFIDADTSSTKSIVKPPRISKEVLLILREAYLKAQKYKHVYVGTEHFLLAILESNAKISRELQSNGLEPEKFKTHLFNFANYPVGLLVKPEGFSQGQDSGQLESLGVDITALARAGKLDPLVGREEEIDRIIKILSRRRKNNPIIVGEAGVGKTALVEGLAQRIVTSEVPPSLKNTRIISINVSDVVAGSKMRGDMEEKILDIIQNVSNSPNTVVFIDEIHSILETGGGGGLDIGQIMKPALVSGSFRVIGATTTSEYSRLFEEDVALNRRFQPVQIDETSVQDTIQILERLKPLLESHHQIKISAESIEEAVNLSDRYITDRFLPDKAIDLLDEATAARRLEIESKFSKVSDLEEKLLKLGVKKEEYLHKGDIESASKARKSERQIEAEISQIEKRRKSRRNHKEYTVSNEDIRKVLSSWTGIPVTTLTAEETDILLKLDKILNKRVIGQKEAVDAVANAIKRSRVGIVEKDRPLASFLFLGPTGVGKTELAKQLTKIMFGNEKNLIQLDMSEMMEMHSVSKLLGSPPGYVGYREGGQLTERIRQKPYSVVLFDEVEKAHPDVLNILLQILEYGHLTDGKGRKASFKNAIIILTSNIGAEEIRTDKILGFKTEEKIKEKSGVMTKKEADRAYESMKEKLNLKLKDVLRPELLNRLDDIVIFRSLLRSDAQKIVSLLISDLNERLAELDAKVKLNKSVSEYLLDEGFSDEYGARPLRRIIQDKVESEISNLLLSRKQSNKIKKCSINVKKEARGLKFTVSKS